MDDRDNPLRHYWHPIALAADVQGDKPLAARLLGTDLVLWRGPEGMVAFRDLCIHRGTRLSLGWVEDGSLVCGYHGWCFGADGMVNHIPSLPRDRAIPARARAERFHCEERFGLVFVCLGEPRRPVYEMPDDVLATHHRHIVGPVYWNTGAARSFENFIDEAHLPWVHHGLLGNRDNVPLIPSREVDQQDGRIVYECQSECNNRIDPTTKTLNRLTYDIVLPFTVFHGNYSPDGTAVLDLFMTAPVDDKTCVRFMVVWRNYAYGEPDDKFVAFTKRVWEQDRVLVEAQRPEEVPTDLAAELHLRGPDGPSVVYRRMLGEIGVRDLG
ncbi:MAG: Rieske 2Fe-2S domain-containing protein [Rhodospirillales bacterium]